MNITITQVYSGLYACLENILPYENTIRSVYSIYVKGLILLGEAGYGLETYGDKKAMTGRRRCAKASAEFIFYEERYQMFTEALKDVDHDEMSTVEEESQII